ncbi:class I SAM-dependent methyltransferase [Candidatus Woesearchaeota archaeon]|nr:class I SAM-dependent methyltransferase [Candidatus Woesearchaeota archaeon]
MQILYKLPEHYKTIINHLVDTNLEINLLDGIFKKHDVKKILDVACGIGRHAIPLSKMGYEVVGIDFSPFQIKKAEDDAKKESSNAQFVLQNANNFSYPEKFDAAICMWTTLGEEPLQYWKVIKNIFQSLRKGGIFVIDNKSWEHIPESKEKFIENETLGDNGEKIKTKIHDRFTEHFRIRDVIHKIGEKEYQDLCVTHILRERLGGPITKSWILEI